MIIYIYIYNYIYTQSLSKGPSTDCPSRWPWLFENGRKLFSPRPCIADIRMVIYLIGICMVIHIYIIIITIIIIHNYIYIFMYIITDVSS